MTLSLRQLGIVLAAVIAACVGAYVYGRSRVPAQTETVEVAGAEKKEVQSNVTVKREAGPVRVTKTKTRPTAKGPETTVTVVEKAPVVTTRSSSLSAQQSETVTAKSESKPVGERWWRVYGEADWRLSALSATPSRVELGADAKVLGPLRLGVKVDGDPDHVKDTAAVSAVVRLEY